MWERLSSIQKKPAHRVIGLMSGTSADGVDAALCELSGAGRGGLKVKLLAEYGNDYPATLRERILNACQSTRLSSAEICELNVILGESFAQAALEVVRLSGLKLDEIDLIGSHGQTISHLPPGKMSRGVGDGATLQIGEAAVIAERTGIPVISNFRARDMAAGGQGAPLVPFVDFLLFSNDSKSRIALNIGGISNLTWLPAGGSPESTIAYDTGPGSMMIDAMVQRFTNGVKAFDASGAIAASGTVNRTLLAEMLEHPYLKRRPPKSTGREEFGASYAQRFYDTGIQHGIAPEDIIATATTFTALTIAGNVRTLGNADELIVAGGGALNDTLMAHLCRELPQVSVTTSGAYGIPIKVKESIAFAILARETLLGRPANLPSATGATGLRILGDLTPA